MTLSDRYRALDHQYGSALVSKALAYLAGLPNDDRVLPERRVELVEAFCRGYQRDPSTVEIVG